MAYVRAFEMTNVADVMEFGFRLPLSLENGSGREFWYLYSRCFNGAELDPPVTVTPSSSGIPDVDAAGSVYKAP
jgi:hypothetical protein